MFSRNVTSMAAAVCLGLWMAATVPLAAAQSADAKPEKPTISPPSDRSSVEEGLSKYMRMQRAVYTTWESAWIPESCKEIGSDLGFSPMDFSVYNVHYDDCSEPWVLCRHKSMPATLEEVILLFSRVPVKTRSMIRTLIGVPQVTGIAGLYVSSGEVVLMNKPGIWTMLHESSHALDYTAQRKSGLISSSGTWRAAYNADPSVASDYARNNFRDHFAETGVAGFYDHYVPGGFSGVQRSASQIGYQIAAFRSTVGQNIVSGGNCTARVPNSKPVQKSTSARLRVREETRPDVAFQEGSGLEVIETSDLAHAEIVACEHNHEHM